MGSVKPPATLPDELIAQGTVAAVLCDPRQPDNPIVACNDAFLRLTGYGRADVLGRNCRFLTGPDTEPELSARLRRAVRERVPTMVEILNYRKDGSRFRNAVMVAPIFDPAGQVEYFLGSQMEVPDHAAQGQKAAPRPPFGDPSTRELARARIAALTPRQRQILRGMAAGKLNKEVAWELSLSERTIKMHRSALLRALDVRSSAEAIRVAVEAGL
jgi:PAS domain S-box-containing protein